jgi:hypothetical protein
VSQLSPFGISLLARIIWSTRIIDRTYRLFDRLRAKSVIAWAPDSFYDVYNDLTYSSLKLRPEDLMPFERRAISRHFPPPPGRVLVGAAGAGREALALARLGYRVLAFEPVSHLAETLSRASEGLSIEAFVGRYETLPIVRCLAMPNETIDLGQREPFEAAVIGWTSFSHLRSDVRCVQTLRQMGALTAGPILLSYFPKAAHNFSAQIGYHRGYSGADIRDLAEQAELELVDCDDDDPWPHAIVRRRPPGA